MRSGTINVPAIVGFGEACRIVSQEVHQEGVRIALLRSQLEKKLAENVSNLKINGIQAERLPNTSSLTVPGVDVDALLLNLPDVMMGTGSACTSGTIEPSHVLQAIGLSRDDASSTIRASLGRFTTEKDIDRAGSSVIYALHNLL